jgi:hypothetical protein
LVLIWGRRNGARAARDIQVEPITSVSPPLFNFAHCPGSRSGGTRWICRAWPLLKAENFLPKSEGLIDQDGDITWLE